MIRRLAASMSTAVSMVVVVTHAEGQWLPHPSPGAPRTSTGQPDLRAPVPRTADGRPDLSGIWLPLADPLRSQEALKAS